MNKQLITALAFGLCVPAFAQENTTTTAEQTDLHVTIYNGNLALVKDQRELTLPTGESTLAFKEVSANIRPNTAILDANGVTLLEQNFEYDLLTPEALLNKFLGKQVTLERRLDDKKITSEIATVLANNNGTVLKVGDQIRTSRGLDNLVFDDLPKDLRDRPTLTMLINNQTAEKQKLTLSYLTQGLNWKADYVASLIDDKTLNLKGWVTLDNSSGTTYKDAKLQLVAGEVNRAPQPVNPRPERLYKSKGAAPIMAMSADMVEETLFEYHLYSLGRPTTIKNRQQKQVSLLEGRAVPYQKQLVIRANDPYSWQRGKDNEFQDLTADAKIVIDNKKANHLGMPLPAGTIRTYQKDSHGNAQFIGEDNIKHTPENEKVTLKLGEAFDITTKRKQTDYDRKRKVKQSATNKVKETIVTASYEVIFKNAKDVEVTVDYLENFMHNWTVKEQSLPSKKLNSTLNRWKINIAAKGETILTYTVEIKI